MTPIPSMLSQHLRLLTCLSALGVVYIHAVTFRFGVPEFRSSFVGRLEAYLSFNLLHVALAIFFANAGFFLFRGAKMPADMLPRLFKRAYSLLIPYLAWAGLWVGLMLAFQIIGGPSAITSVGDVLYHWLWAPFPGQFWFLRDLIMLTVLSPLIIALPRPALAALVFGAFVWWLTDQTNGPLELRDQWFEVISNEALAWFGLGALAGRHAAKIYGALMRKRPLWQILLLAGASLALPFVTLPWQWAQGLCVLCGALALYLLCPYAGTLSGCQSITRLSGFAFLIFAAHHPAISLSKAALLSLAPASATLHLLTYSLLPLVLSGAIIGAGLLTQRIAPRTLSIFNGGRALHDAPQSK